MGIYEHARQFAGLGVVEWDSQATGFPSSDTAYRIGVSYDDEAGASTTASEPSLLSSSFKRCPASELEGVIVSA